MTSEESLTTMPIPFSPSAEQRAIIDAFLAGEDICVQAGAGCGKSATLAVIADAQLSHLPGRRARFITFNKRNATEVAETFAEYGLTNAEASTAHSMAYRACVSDPKLKHMVDNMRREFPPIKTEMEMFDIPKVSLCLRATVDYDFDAKKYRNVVLPSRALPFTAQRRYLTLARDTVTRFCQSADTQVSQRHVPYLGEMEPELRPLVREALADTAALMWAELSSATGRLKTGHAHYLKAWSLTHPKIGSKGDVLLYDEAQDCQPEGTKVLTTKGLVPIEEIRPGDGVISYIGRSCRLRVNGAMVTSVGCRPVDEELISVATEDGNTSRYTAGHICVAKVGAALEGKHILYAMRRGNAWRVGVTSAYHGRRDGRGSSSGLSGRLREEQADAVWILDVFSSRQDALLTEAGIPARFGIPDLRFIDNGHGTIGQGNLDGFWYGMGDLNRKAKKLLASYGRDIKYPFVKRESTGRGYLLYTRATTIRACNLITGMEVLNGEKLLQRNRQVQTRFNDPLWTTIQVSRETYRGNVWSLDVADDHTYIADGIVTHNCNPVLADVVLAQRGRVQLVLVGDEFQSLYGFTGAMDAMAGFAAQDGVVTLPLSESRRFGQDIADVANEVLNVLDPEHRNPMRLRGVGPAGGRVLTAYSATQIASADAVVCATNGQVIEEVVTQIAAGRTVACTLDIGELVSLAGDVELVQTGRAEDAKEPSMRRFRDLDVWTEWLDKPGADDALLHSNVQIVLRHGAPQLQQLADKVIDKPDEAEVTVSTIHKAKGGTWDRVLVNMGEQRIKVDNIDKLRMLYVAVTRARELVLLPAHLLDFDHGDDEAAPVRISA